MTSQHLFLSRESVLDLRSRQTFIGRGLWGEVGLVPWHTEGGVAVLKLPKEDISKTEIMFYREVNIMNLLNGVGGAPRVLCINEDLRAILMTYHGPHTLQEVIQCFDLPDWYLSLVGLEIVRRLNDIHEAGVIYNDIHTRNILVTIHPGDLSVVPVVSFVDFGQSALTEEFLGRLSDDARRRYSELWSDDFYGTITDDIVSVGIILGIIFGRMMEAPESVWNIVSMTRLSSTGERVSLPEVSHALQQLVQHMKVTWSEAQQTTWSQTQEEKEEEGMVTSLEYDVEEITVTEEYLEE